MAIFWWNLGIQDGSNVEGNCGIRYGLPPQQFGHETEANWCEIELIW